MLKIPITSDFLSGLLFVVFGSGFVTLSLNYEMGSAVSMGPGYFPIFLGFGVILIGLTLVAKSLLKGLATDESTVLHIRPALFVLGSMVVFALTLRSLGVVVASSLMVALASFASPESQRFEVVLLAVGLAIFSALVFVYGLGVPMPIWPRIL